MERWSRTWKTGTQSLVLAYAMWFTIGNYVAGTAIWPATIADPNGMHFMHLLGFIPVMVNGWHLYFHLATGLMCLWLSTTVRGAIAGGLTIGAVYVVTGALGLVVSGNVYGLIMADTFGNWVHVAEGTGLILVGVAGVAIRTSARGPLRHGAAQQS